MAQTIGFGDLDDQENQNQQNGQQNQQGGQPTAAPTTTPGAGQQGSVSGAGGNGAGGPAGTQQGKAPGAGNPATGAALGQMARPATYNQQNQGTGFQNLQNYVQANNPSQLQNTVASGLENQNQTVLNNLGQSEQQFAQGTAQNQANTNANQQVVQQILANPTAFTNLNGMPSNVAAAATAGGTPTQANVQNGNLFSQLMGGQYQGPAGLANAADLQGQAQNAQQSAAGLGTPGGRQAVLQQLLGSPSYNTGEQQFDSALLGQGNNANLTQAATQARALNPLVNQGVTGAAAQGTEQANAAKQFGQQTQGQFGQAVTNLNNTIQQNVASAQNSQNAAYQQLVTDAQSGNLTQAEATELGVTGGQQVTTDDLAKLGTFIAQNPNAATAQNTATAQQYAKLDALGQLAGSNAPSAASGILSNYAGQEGQAGSFNNNQSANVNQSALNTLVNNDTSAYNSAENAAQGRIGNANEMNRWANNGGGLTAGDYAQAQAYGINPQAIQAAQQAGGPGAAQEALGQMLWQAMLAKTYPQGSGNSQFLNSDWTRGQVQLADQNLATVNNQLQQTYGGEQAFNITPQGDATQNALQAMAQGTVINRNT